MCSAGGFAAAALLFFQTLNGDPSEPASTHSIRIPFVENLGQTDPAVAFYAPSHSSTMFVMRNGSLFYALGGTKSELVEERFVEGSASPTGEWRGPTEVSYFLGRDRNKWLNRVPTFRVVSLGDVWHGVRVVLRADARGIEKIFRIAPFASEKSIRIRVEGAQSIQITDRGGLRACTSANELVLTPPRAYQEVGGRYEPVTVRYAAKGREYGFVLGIHDPRLPVIIDPLLQSTYLGGGAELGPEGFDEAVAAAIHPSSGDVYLAGTTYSFNFPGTASGAQPMIGGFYDAFVARLDPSLRVLRQATFLGANSYDSARALVIRPTSGDVYVAGVTGSVDFPGTAGGAQPAFGGTFGFANDGFIARFNADLTTLVQATYLGGTSTDEINGLALHLSSEDIYAVGETTSNDFPDTTGGAQAAPPAFRSAFVARLSPDLVSLRQASYLGGDHFSRARAVAISGDVYVVGETGSRDFPATTGGAQQTFGGGSDSGGDGFIARLAPDLLTIYQSSYLGGVQDDSCTALVVSRTSGEVYVGGYTNSLDFPGTAGGAQALYGGGIRDAFLVRLDARLTSLIRSTYFGGDGLDEARSIAIHPIFGDLYMGGKTASAALPGSAGGVQPTFGGGSDVGGDAFVLRLDPSLTSIGQSTYLGGTRNDEGNAVAIHSISGDVYLVGGTFSTNFPGTAGGAQPALGGFNDAFAARLTPDLTSGPRGPGEPIPTVSASGLLLLVVLLASMALHILGRSSGPGSAS